MKNKIPIILYFLIMPHYVVLSQNGSPPISDLDTLYQTLILNHPKLKCGKDRVLFDSLYERILSKFESYSTDQKILEMSKLVASIHDGHTQMGLAFDSANHFHQLPLKLYIYSDGMFIRRAAEPYGQYSGMKVLKIGMLPIDTIIKRTLPFVHGENQSAVNDILPSRIIISEVLAYIGATLSLENIPVLLEDSLHKQYTVILKTVFSPSGLKWISANNTTKPPPFYLQNPDKNYWFRYIDSLKVLYFQFNVVEDMDDFSFDKFVKNMFKSIDSLPLNRMVIDIRNNNGGDNTLNKYLIHALIRSDKVNQKGVLYVIIGRLTFSAAVNLTADLESNTNAIFVGEPTAAGPNHYGETKVLHLPASHLIVLYSTQYWQSSLPWDKRTSIEPNISIEFKSSDFRNNQDPYLEAIMKLTKR